MPTTRPPGLVGDGLGDETDPQPKPPTPQLVGGQQGQGQAPPAWNIPGIQPPPNLGRLVAQPDRAPVLTGWGLETHYKKYLGRSFNPLCGGPPDGPAVSQNGVHKPFMVKKVTCVAEAVGGPPPVPSSDTGDPNDWLLSEDIIVATPPILPAGDQLWRVAVVYYYVMLGNPCTLTGYAASSHPLGNTSPALNVLKVSDFRPMLGGVGGGIYNGQAVNF